MFYKVQLLINKIYRLINIQSSATVNNIENTIKKYTKVADALLEYESNNIKLQGESYIDSFKFKIKNLYSNSAQYKNKSPEIFKKLIFADFYAAHENFIDMINTKIKKTQNKLSNLINDTINTIRDSKGFIFISDESSCIVSKLIDKIDEIKCNINDNCKLINANIICIQNPDINIEEQKLKYRKNLITKPVKKLIEILNKQILFNSNDKNLIINTQNIINNMKSRLQCYIND
ncbi:MAG: hypothetical protein IJU54_01600 [Alphaproteobacteria bacterium]|nr:hypothetical protein [Alphaproteobacteria bacterium]